jgi:hypothetical protein
MIAHILTVLLLWTHPDPRSLRRLTDLETVALDIASTDATAEEAETLVAVCVHESGCRPRAVGSDGSVGAFQIRKGPGTAAEALRRLRWSASVCGDLSLYAGCGRCGACPEIVASLVDPTLPRR